MKHCCFNPQITAPNVAAALLFTAILLASLVAFPGKPAFAQQEPEVVVNVEPRVVQAGGRLTYTIEVSTPNNFQIDLERDPDFGELQVMGRMTAPQFMLRNNVASRQLTVTYTLGVPREPGIHRIEPPIVRVGQSRYTPVSLDVKVVEHGDLPAPKPQANQHYYLEVQATPDRNPFVGEQILISYDLLVDTRKIQVRPRPPSEPALDAFWVEDLSDQTSGRRKAATVNGRLMEQTSLRTFIAFPLVAGPATIDSMTIPLVQGSFFGPSAELSAASEEFTIEVQPLPDGAPKGFHAGNVGQWNFDAVLSTSNTNVGEPITLTLKASGRGRASQLKFPALLDIDGLRMIHDTNNSTRDVRATVLHGTHTQTITLMPLAEGEKTIAPLSFSYFDPETASYQTITTQPLTMNVGPGTLPAEPEPEDLNVARTIRNTDDITTTLLTDMQPEFADHTSPRDTRATFNWLAAAPPVFGILLLLFGPRLIRRRPGSNRTKKQQKALWNNINDQISTAESKTDDPKSGFSILSTALNTYFIESLNFPPGALSERDLRPFFNQYKVDPELQSELFNIATTCNSARFAPTSSSTKDDLLATARRLRTALKQLDKHLARKNYPARTSVVSLVIFAMFAVFHPPVSALEFAKPPPNAIDWQQLADAHTTDAILQYNAASNLTKAGDYPRARLYLERAALLDAGHPAIKTNLSLIREVVVHNAISKRHPRFSEPLGAWQTAAAIPQNTLNHVFILTLWFAFFALVVHRLAGKATSPRAMQIQTTATVLLWICITTFVINATAATARTLVLHNANPAIVVTDSPALREGPSSFAALTRTNNRAASGMMVNILESRDGWLKVEVSNETYGWMQSTDVSSIRP